MPPRKRARVSQATSPTASLAPKTPTPAESSPGKEEEEEEEEDILNDPWTDEEEIGLFKGLIRYKPAGIHKHFHLLSLHQFMLEGGYIHPRNEHTKPNGIWRKLQTLYNLEALDEREDARQLDKMELGSNNDDSGSDEEAEEEEEDVYSEAANKIANEDFELPGAEWEERKWANRLASEKQRRDESPPVLPEVNLAEQVPVWFTPSFSVEPADGGTTKGRGRTAGTVASARGRGSATARTRRSARQSESVAPDGDELVEEAVVEGEEEESGEGEEASERSTPATRSTRSRGRPAGQTKGRGRPRGR